MNKDLQLFIIWEKARYKEKNILEDLNQRFEVIKTFVVKWPEKDFSANLSRLYGKKLAKTEKKKELCGCGEFSVTIVNDQTPNYVEGKNINISSAKMEYRKLTGGGHLIHASDNSEEMEDNLLVLTGMSVEEFLKKGTREKLSNTWNSEEELLEFVAKLPKTEVRPVLNTHLIITENVAKVCRLLKASKRLFFMKRNLYQVNINGENKEIYIRRAV